MAPAAWTVCWGLEKTFVFSSSCLPTAAFQGWPEWDPPLGTCVVYIPGVGTVHHDEFYLIGGLTVWFGVVSQVQWSFSLLLIFFRNMYRAFIYSCRAAALWGAITSILLFHHNENRMCKSEGDFIAMRYWASSRTPNWLYTDHRINYINIYTYT
jgi:hypothetical protein